MKKIAILGSTGSIGTQTLEIVDEQGDLEVVALSAGGNITLLEEQMRKYRPQYVSVWEEEKAKELLIIGFIDKFKEELPMEYAIELNALLKKYF